MKKWQQLRSASRKCRYHGNDTDGAVRYLRQAIDTAVLSDPVEVALLLNSLSNLLTTTGDFVGAEDAAKRSITEEQRYGPPIAESDRLASYHSALAVALQKQGKYLQALAAVDEAIRIFALHIGETEDLMKNLNRLRAELQQETWRG